MQTVPHARRRRLHLVSYVPHCPDVNPAAIAAAVVARIAALARVSETRAKVVGRLTDRLVQEETANG
jgi:hypothetical protein